MVYRVIDCNIAAYLVVRQQSNHAHGHFNHYKKTGMVWHSAPSCGGSVPDVVRNQEAAAFRMAGARNIGCSRHSAFTYLRTIHF